MLTKLRSKLWFADFSLRQLSEKLLICVVLMIIAGLILTINPWTVIS